MRLSLLLSTGDDERLLLEVARQADRRGLAALWLPGPFPNPAVAAAAVAVVTRRISMRAAGLALHNPIRVAEEWSLVDNLSGGRVGIAFDSADGQGKIETVHRLWRGEAVRVPDGEGRPIEVRILPQPIQRELPLWRLLTEPDAGRVAETGLRGFSPSPGWVGVRVGEGRGEGLRAGGSPHYDDFDGARVAETGGLVTGTAPAFASVEDGLRELKRWEALGVDEVACRVRLADALEALEVLAEIHHGG